VSAPLPPSPLEGCPGTPNCHAESRAYDLDARTLWLMAEHALSRLHPQQVVTDEKTLHVDAEFKAFVFTDDVALRAVGHEGGSVLHVRSASRIGRSDLGVNKRRVRKLFAALGDVISEHQASERSGG
jgi:uncharacterized protein (DUF1499 family)